MENISIDKTLFNKMKGQMKPWLKDHCNYCGKKIDEDTFGFLSKNITSCKSELCLMLAVNDLEEMKRHHKKTEVRNG